MKPLIVDNFIDQQSFQNLKNTMLGENFCWNYSDTIDYADDKDKFQFTHSFYKENLGPNSVHYGILGSILQRLRIKEIYRIKANLVTRTSEIVPNRLIIWPSNFLFPHSVLPVTKGLRYSVVAWAF